MTDRETLVEWIDKVEHEGINLTPWEADFMESMKDRRDLGQTFSEKQAELIERIYSQRTA